MKYKYLERLKLRVNSIRTRMILVFLITSLLTSFTSMFISSISKNLINRMEEMFTANVEIESFLTLMDSVDKNITDYLVSDDSDSMLNYYKSKDIFLEKATEMFDPTAGIYSENDLINKDILYMVNSYLAELDSAVAAKNINDADGYIARYAEADQISQYIRTYADKVNLQTLDINTNQYLSMSSDLNRLFILNMVLISTVIVLSLFAVFYLTYNLTKPIVKLADTAEEMTKGNFDADDLVVATDDELKVMANAFNAMKHSIKQYISELHDKADTESQLLEQQIENLKMQSLLESAELKALQMQINPHFLFNTLNAGVQLAMIEGADRTSNFLDDIAKIFRYNVNSLDRVVKIKDEIDMVRAYGNMFHVRFGDAIRFNYDIDLSLFNIEIPPLVIQPFVENATIHGIGNYEQGGIINITLKRDGNIAKIIISDNGVGMDKKTMKMLNDGIEFKQKKSGHTTGIGIYNVVHRLRLFFGVEDVLEVVSAPNEGASFTLKIPITVEPKRRGAKEGAKKHEI
jgi:two-component system, sensor histidine kinase YesM